MPHSKRNLPAKSPSPASVRGVSPPEFLKPAAPTLAPRTRRPLSRILLLKRRIRRRLRYFLILRIGRFWIRPRVPASLSRVTRVPAGLVPLAPRVSFLCWILLSLVLRTLRFGLLSVSALRQIFMGVLLRCIVSILS